MKTMNTRQIYTRSLKQEGVISWSVLLLFLSETRGNRSTMTYCPTFLKAFNYKTIWNLMPLKSKPSIATYQV